jgi:hypothetical protein
VASAMALSHFLVLGLAGALGEGGDDPRSMRE